MRRVLVVVILALVPLVALVSAMLGTLAEDSTTIEHILDHYVAYKQYTLRVKQIKPATRPWNFTRAMSAATIGDSARYQTNADFSGQLTHGPMVFQSTVTTYSLTTHRISLPYPPRQIECVLIEDFKTNAFEVVLVALHEDLYNGAWIVHELADPAAVTNAIGCSFR